MRRDAWRRARPAGDVHRVSISAGGWNDGTAAADHAIDSGAGALLAIDSTTPSAAACAIAALYANVDATAVVSGTTSDLEWMQCCAEIRDAMVALRPSIGNATALLADDPQLSFLVALITESAQRRTPLVIAGALPHIAALVAQRLTSSSAAWVFSAVSDASATTTIALKRLSKTTWASIDWPLHDEALETVVRALVADLD